MHTRREWWKYDQREKKKTVKHWKQGKRLLFVLVTVVFVIFMQCLFFALNITFTYLYTLIFCERTLYENGNSTRFIHIFLLKIEHFATKLRFMTWPGIHCMRQLHHWIYCHFSFGCLLFQTHERAIHRHTLNAEGISHVRDCTHAHSKFTISNSKLPIFLFKNFSPAFVSLLSVNSAISPWSDVRGSIAILRFSHFHFLIFSLSHF